MKVNVYVNVSEGPFHCEYFGNPVAVTERYGDDGNNKGEMLEVGVYMKVLKETQPFKSKGINLGKKLAFYF